MKLSGILGFVAIAAVVVLSGCGGGGSNPDSRVSFPDCKMGVDGKDDLAGCWVSERCATNFGSAASFRSARGLEYITQDSTVPAVSGSIYSYLLEYDSPDCTGRPSGIIDFTASLKSNGVDLSVTYEELGYALCGDIDAPASDDVLCVRMDVASDHRKVGADPVMINGDVYYRIEMQSRLCLDAGNYNFDNEGQGGINPGWTVIADPYLDMAPGACLTRFVP